ncbi:hypothetical protein A2160_03680 [Candidatus Beckwithbacteria bacterium RBG_13_42_9]|uniref:Uncharacterized protein n=1 Tax=Candidatus Beckwithbacteria bacterium RBG_13_42_9 TaxID=1797457 RepID=A0A1F5E8K6_9BACT|nr:MAG: hypothetical protein A2160_03680 [Candidatus Beckwithbacteria bacterium RBG_13_42_9]
MKAKNNRVQIPSLYEVFAILLFVAFPFIGFYLGIRYQQEIYRFLIPPKDPVITVYSGKLACADCSGIEETITLSQGSQDIVGGTYTLKDVYLGKNISPYLSSGTWVTTQGTFNNPKAKVIKLNPKNSKPIYLLIVNDDTLKILDNNKREINSSSNQTLTKQ